MFRWIPYTFIRISLFFIAGILLAIYLPDVPGYRPAFNLLLILTAVYISAFIFFRVTAKKAFFNLGLIGLPATFLAGYVHVIGQTESRYPDHILSLGTSVDHYEAVITGYSEERRRSWKVEARIIAVHTAEWKNKHAKVMLYFSKDDFQKPFRYGDKLLIKGSPQRVPPAGNPGEFDYGKFLGYRGIYHQHFLRGQDVALVGFDPPDVFMQHAITARLWADRTLKTFVDGDREQAIASALVLGVTDALDSELLNAYAASGAMHVLAVSGLHISIVYLILLWLMKPVQKLRSGKWIIAITSLVVLWSYAFVTGLSPSVLRAVTMFTFIALARPANQGTNIYNTLAASAFCLLIYDPFLVMSVGFQLSYLAVLGIVYLEPRFYRWYEARTWFSEQVWKITCVSIAAQVATFVPALLYFHQFPNYFLLSNLLVIPISFLVLVLGLGVLAASIVTWVASAIGYLLTLLITTMNVVVFFIESLPYSVVGDIHITLPQALVLAALTVCFVLLFEQRRFYYGVIATGFVVLFCFLQWLHFHSNINVQKFTVYNVSGHSAIDLIDRGHAYFLADSALVAEPAKIMFHIRPNRLASGVDRVYLYPRQPFLQEFEGGRLICWKSLVIAQITDRQFTLPRQVQPDFIIIGNNAVRDLNVVNETHRAARIILDSSNSFYNVTNLLRQAEHLKRPVHAISVAGAFVHNSKVPMDKH